MKFRKFWEANFLIMELLLAVICSMSFAVWSEFINNGEFINRILLDGREVLYGALVALFGSMLGFSITAVSIVIGYANSDKLEIVRKSKQYKDLWKVFESAMKVLALATLLALIGLIVDKNVKPVNLVFYVNMFFSILSFFRIARSIWVLENIIAIIAKPKI
jgi:hypothetical protein